MNLDVDANANFVAFLQILHIKSISQMARRIMKFIQTQSGTPAQRCALAVVLWYIANPTDVMPDDVEGGVGFLDDGCILYLMASEYLLTILKPERITKEDLLNNFYTLFIGVPKELHQPLSDQVACVSIYFRVYNDCELDIPDEEKELEKILNNMEYMEKLAQLYLQDKKGTYLPVPTEQTYVPDTSRLTVSRGGDSIYQDGYGGMSVSFADGSNIAMSPGGDLIW